jgi:cell division protein WhiA
LAKGLGHSFAADVRNELLHINPRHQQSQKAELCAEVQVCGSIVIASSQMSLRIETSNASLAKKLFSSIKSYTGERVTLSARENRRLDKRSTVLMDLSGRDLVLPFISGLGIYQDGNLLRTMPELYRRKCCKRSYLRGLFLSCGSVSNPEIDYHLEWVLKDELMAQSLQALLADLDIDAQTTVRKNHRIVYIKGSEAIAQTLAQMGAAGALFAIENARILHEMKNRVNRAVNCETANVKKTVGASMRQVACIEYLAKTGHMAALPAHLVQAADVRLSNPQASLEELASMTSPAVTKSAMNHRLRRLVELAEQNGFIGAIGGESNG